VVQCSVFSDSVFSVQFSVAGLVRCKVMGEDFSDYA
jgi:hypothetical protein